MRQVLLVRYGEIALRGGNRKIFENMLISRIKERLSSRPGYYVIKEQGRFVVDNGRGVDFGYVIPRVTKLFGLLGVSPCAALSERGIEAVQAAALEQMRRFSEAATFKVITRRADKSYPLVSNEVSALAGGFILEHMPHLRVDVHKPQIELRIEIRNEIYIYSEFIPGAGGLPTGSSGKATLLLSGGFDSPVAGFLTAKRGVTVEAVYFHSPPYTSGRAREKVIALAEKLAEYTGRIRLYVVPFTDTQVFLRDRVPHEKLVTFMKRAMMKAAEIIALKSGSLGLVTGDSIGQVASQTMESLFVIDAAAGIPVYRPLSGMDKQEIIDLAAKIGTEEISMLPYEDCCTLFVAPHPETKPKKSYVEWLERRLEPELGEMIAAAAGAAEVIELEAD